MSEMFGPYRLDGLLGRGGMGEVWRALDTRKRDRVVALKLLPAHLSADEEYRARFRREAEIAAVLREPHVIPIHEYGEIDDRLYLDMRLVDGVDLATVIERAGPLDPVRAVAIVEQVAAALDAAHAEGLIHRDVKPSNVLVAPGPPEFVYLVDFGIARGARTTAHGRVTGTGVTIGTLEYMAPERFVGQPVDHRADVYALACVLFEMLTGRPPFTGEAPMVMHGHLAVAVPRLGGPAAALSDVVARGMAKEPAARFGSAGELAAASRAALLPVAAATWAHPTHRIADTPAPPQPTPPQPAPPWPAPPWPVPPRPASPRPPAANPPAAVRTSFTLWVVSISLFLLNFLIGLAADGGGLLRDLPSDPTLRAITLLAAASGFILAAVHLLLAVKLRRGRPWARILLLVGMIVLTGSWIMGLIFMWLKPAEFATADSGAQQVASLVLNAAEVALWIVATIFMYRPSAAAYFARDPATPVVSTRSAGST